MASFTQELVLVVGQLSKDSKMNRLEMQSGRRFVVGTLAMSLVVTVGASSVHAVPLPAPVTSHIASNDLVDGNNLWENTGSASGFDWNLGASQSPATGLVDTMSSITSAYQFPAATGTTVAYNAYNAADATFEMWFRPSNLTGEHVLYENGGDASTAITLDENVVRFGSRRTAVSGIMNAEVALSAAATERFNHIVGVIHFNNGGPGTGQIDLYLNDELVDSDTVGSGFTLWTGSGTSGLGSPNGATFAGDSLLSGAPTDFDGQIGVFNFYTSALDADQVTEAYNNFFTPPPVPEPSTCLLLGLGLPALMRHRPRRSRA